MKITEEVQTALLEGRGVVGLESTIFSNLGLPSPANEEALHRSLAAVRSSGSVPAITAIIDGAPRVGLDPSEHHRILGEARKTSERELGLAIGQGWAVGATTVSASLALCAAAGVSVFATGGIGGVHQGSELTGDVSADLGAIARHPVLTVCAGAKSFLDLPKTLELLETLGAPVIGYQTDDFPMFYSASSGIHLGARVDTPEEMVRVLNARRALNGGGTVLAVPVPLDQEIPSSAMLSATEQALADADKAGLTGPQITPFVLARLSAVTEGRTIPTNLALAENNARVAGEVAMLLAASE
jgi:pseudouridine-5'-phosphate glycosidase